MENTKGIKIGDYVICINAKAPCNFEIEIKQGEVYKVVGKSKCTGCGQNLFLLEGIKDGPDKTCIVCGSTGLGEGYFLSFRFEPFKYNILSNKEILKNMINEKHDSKILKSENNVKPIMN